LSVSCSRFIFNTASQLKYLLPSGAGNKKKCLYPEVLISVNTNQEEVKFVVYQVLLNKQINTLA
jgi:hypothetical protein